MKSLRRLTLLLCAVTLCTINSYGQQIVKEAFDAIPPTSLPYTGNKLDQNTEPVRLYTFPYSQWSGYIDYSLYDGFRVTSNPTVTNDSDICVIYRTFTPTNGNYLLGTIMFGPGDYYRKLLVTADPYGNYIDSIEIGAGGAGPDDYYHLKEWKINENMEVEVYFLNIITPQGLKFTDIFPSEVFAQVVRLDYVINPDGKFKYVNSRESNPNYYPKIYLTSPDIHLWD